VAPPCIRLDPSEGNGEEAGGPLSVLPRIRVVDHPGAAVEHRLYAREFLGEKAAYVAGWMYFFNWACTSIVDVTAIALYMHYWGTFDAMPQWSIALIALVIVLTVNMISVKLFGEMEFWVALMDEFLDKDNERRD
jgi:hypothetical protein